MIVANLLLLGHSWYRGTLDFDDFKFAVPMIAFFLYLLLRKKNG